MEGVSLSPFHPPWRLNISFSTLGNGFNPYLGPKVGVPKLAFSSPLGPVIFFPNLGLWDFPGGASPITFLVGPFFFTLSNGALSRVNCWEPFNLKGAPFFLTGEPLFWGGPPEKMLCGYFPPTNWGEEFTAYIHGGRHHMFLRCVHSNIFGGKFK